MLNADSAWSVIPYGERALLVQFESRIDPEINDLVVHLFKALKASDDVEIEFMVPAYCSLTIGLRSTGFDLSDWKSRIAERLQRGRAGRGGEVVASAKDSRRLVEIPVCYEPPYSLDLDQVVAFSDLSADAVIERHLGTTYRVYMLGFLPGFAYLGSVESVIACPRKKQPRSLVPAGSVGIADSQTGVYPCDAPGGWQIIGRTPIAMNLCDPESLRPGDEVRFRRIDASTFQALRCQRGNGECQ